MVDSVIHRSDGGLFMAVTRHSYPSGRFDTSVVDLTADVADPVELLMKVQLGGVDQHRQCRGVWSATY